MDSAGSLSSPERESVAAIVASGWANRSLIWIFANRDLKARFRGTLGGWLWSLLLPLSLVLIYSVVFSVIIRIVPPDFGNGGSGRYFVWLLVGLVPWTFMTLGMTTGMGALLTNGALLQKVYFPSFVPTIASVLSVGVQSLVELGVVAVLLLFFVNFGWTWLLVPFWIALIVLFVVSGNYILAVANIYFRDMSHIMTVVFQIIFFVSPIIYPATQIPQTWNGIPIGPIMALNPFANLIEMGRDLFYGLTLPSEARWLYAALWSLVSFAVAVLVYRRAGRDIGEAV